MYFQVQRIDTELSSDLELHILPVSNQIRIIYSYKFLVSIGSYGVEVSTLDFETGQVTFQRPEFESQFDLSFFGNSVTLQNTSASKCMDFWQLPRPAVGPRQYFLLGSPRVRARANVLSQHHSSERLRDDML